MNHFRALILVAALAVAPAVAQTSGEKPMISIAIHGGAGVITRSSMSAADEAAYRTDLSRALDAGYEVLQSGGTSLDAVTAAVRILEDSPLFNAGRGAVFSHDGINELDASIMDGRTLRAGAVTGVRHVRNPVDLARLVMERSPHVMLSGEGAEEFARACGIDRVPNGYFTTERRQRELELLQQGRKQAGREALMGTVGAVALDAHGDVSAATSTGGMTGKKWGRIGDSPIIGAGTYAANDCCAVSATGHGEFFIRAIVAHEIASLMPSADPRQQPLIEQIHARLAKLPRFVPEIAVATLQELDDALAKLQTLPPAQPETSEICRRSKRLRETIRSVYPTEVRERLGQYQQRLAAVLEQEIGVKTILCDFAKLSALLPAEDDPAVEAEMNKVSWPSKAELIRSSLVVIFVLFFLAVVLFGFDLVWGFLFEHIGILKKSS